MEIDYVKYQEGLRKSIINYAEKWLNENLNFKGSWCVYLTDNQLLNELKFALSSIANKTNKNVINKFISFASDADDGIHDVKFSIQELNDCYDDILAKFSEIAGNALNEIDECTEGFDDGDNSSYLMFNFV